MKGRVKVFLSWLLTMAMVIGLLPGISLGGGVQQVKADELLGALSRTAAVTGSGVHVLDASDDLQAMSAGAAADGDEMSAGTDDYFTIIMSAKMKVDSSSKTFDDGYSGSQRINFGGTTSTSKNAIMFETEAPATVKIYWASGGDGRRVGVLDTSGNVVVSDGADSVKNSAYISTLELAEAGTWYLGGPDGSNYLFRIEVEEEVTVQEYTLDASDDLQAMSAGAAADGDEMSAGTDDYFTIIMSAKMKVDSSSKTFDDGYSGSQRINFGGTTSTSKNAIMFETEAPATVKIYWASGGDGRRVGVLDTSGNVVVSDGADSVKNSAYISTLELAEAGTWYLGGPDGSNYIFKVVVTVGAGEETERADWATVDEPVIDEAGITQEAGKVIVPFEMVIGDDGADKVVITMKDANGASLGEKTSRVEGTGASVEFTPKASGTYTFSIVASREEETDKVGEDASFYFILPLPTPIIKSIRGAGTGSVVVTWEETAEAEQYEVFMKVKGADDGTYTSLGATTDTSVTATGLTDGEYYTFKIKANRMSTGDSSEVSMDKYISGLDELEFVAAPVGSGAKGTVSGGFYEEDAVITITAKGGKVGDSEDGFVYYYTELDADDNFIMEGTFEVTDVNVGGTMSNQTSFGIIAIDTIGGANNGNGRYFNSAGAVTAKFKKLNTETGSASSFDNLAGLRVVTGYTDASATVGASTRVLNNTNSAFEYPDSNAATFTYDVGDTYHFILRRSNTGYHGTLVKEDGTEIERIFYYPAGDDYTDPLLVQDSEHIYVGLMASRYIEVDVTDVALTIIDPADDEPRIDPPTQYTVPSIKMYSTTTIGTEEYPFEYRANIAGHLEVTDSKGNVLIDKDVTANEYVEEIFTLKKGNNTFTCTLTPSTEELLESYEPIERTLTVSYKTYGEADQTIVVAPNGKSSGTGSESKPLDIYTAFSYAQPGQTILLKNGTYNLTGALKVGRGHDGTADERITVVAETPGEVVIDLEGSSGGINISADYWYLYGLEICNAEFGVKPVHIQGNNNIVELCSVHDNGDSGIQISGSSEEPYEKWPSYNLVKNCDAYDNADYKGNDADGFAAKLTSGDGNVFDGCIAHHNIDDGWDLYAKSTTGSIGAVEIKNSVTYANGYLSENARLRGKLLAEDQGEGNGFKLGGESMPGAHVLRNSISFANGAKGVTSNSGPDCIVYDVTAYGNATFGSAESLSLYTNSAATTNYIADGVISMAPVSGKADKRALKGQSSLDSDTNYFWNGSKAVNASGAEASEDWFENVDVTIVPTRNADGSINMHGLLQLTSAAPSDAGARLEKVISVYPEIPEAIVDKVVDDDSDSDYDDDGSSSGSGSGSSSSGPSTTTSQPATGDLGDTTGVWMKDDKGWWYQKADATYPTDSWLKVKGAWYLFGTDGYMKTGWQIAGGKWYYLDSVNGDMKTGWHVDTDGRWYMLDSVNGDMKTGWYLDTDGKWYFLDLLDGFMRTGWIQIPDGKWYYFGLDGACLMNTVTPDGYKLDENGVWIQ